MFGDGPLRGELEQLAYCDPRITFHGHCDDPLEPMRSIDALLMPSRWEAYGLVAREAQSAGRKVIVATIDGLQDHISSGAIDVHDHSIAAGSRAITRAADAVDKNRRTKKPKPRTGATRFEAEWEPCLESV